MFTFTSHQLSISCTFWIVAFLAGIAGSLQAPFYTKEANDKGVNQINVGLVFAIYHFTIFSMSPLFGMYLGKIGAKRMVDVGIFVMGSCAIGFGALGYVDNSSTFAGMSYLIRGIEAVGHSSFKTATFAVITKEFPETVGFMYASLQASFGAGLMLGPFIGGVLYHVGGFVLPFVFIGSLITLSSAITYIFLPSYINGTTADDRLSNNAKKGILDALKVPEILVQATCTLGATISIGFLQATLRDHLDQFNLSDLLMGTMFVVQGGTFALSSPCWGYLCDKKINGMLVAITGAILNSLAFLLIGPVSFIPIPTTFCVCVATLAIQGTGVAAQLVASFAISHQAAIATGGFPDNINTYAIISGLCTSLYSAGAFIGPSVGGIMVEKMAFRRASIFVLVIEVFIVTLTITHFVYKNNMYFCRRANYQSIE